MPTILFSRSYDPFCLTLRPPPGMTYRRRSVGGYLPGTPPLGEKNRSIRIFSWTQPFAFLLNSHAPVPEMGFYGFLPNMSPQENFDFLSRFLASGGIYSLLSAAYSIHLFSSLFASLCLLYFTCLGIDPEPEVISARARICETPSPPLA